MPTIEAILSIEELKKLNVEFAVIEKTLQNAKKQPISLKSKTSLKPEIVKDLFLKNLITSKENVPSKNLNTKIIHREKGTKPVDQPVDLKGLSSIPLYRYKNTLTKESFLTTFEELFKKVQQSEINETERELAFQEMSRFFNEVGFQPFEHNQSLWWNFKKDEAFTIADKINQITKTLLDLKKNLNPNQYEFESYLQMWRISDFLNATASGKWVNSDTVEMMVYEYTERHPSKNRLYRQISSSTNETLMKEYSD